MSQHIVAINVNPMETKTGQNDKTLLSFPQKLGMTALLVIVILLVRATFNVFLMVLAASLIALYFHGLAGLIVRKLKLSRKWAMGFSIGGTFILVGLLFWLIGSKVQAQAQELSSSLPTMVEQAKSQLQKSAIGQQILEQISSANSRKMAGTVKKLFSSSFGVLGDLYVILFLGIFLTASPGIYRKGVIALVPSSGEKQAGRIMDELGGKLKSWLKGKMFAMAVVAVLTVIALSIIGITMAVVLSLIAGLLNFIPNFGPIMAMVPAVLIGLTKSPETALLIAGIYTLIQVIESNFITPTVQNKLVNIPPAMIITGQLIVGSLTGYLGVVFATPIVLIVMILVQELYIKKKKKHASPESA